MCTRSKYKLQQIYSREQTRTDFCCQQSHYPRICFVYPWQKQMEWLHNNDLWPNIVWHIKHYNEIRLLSCTTQERMAGLHSNRTYQVYQPITMAHLLTWLQTLSSVLRHSYHRCYFIDSRIAYTFVSIHKAKDQKWDTEIKLQSRKKLECIFERNFSKQLTRHLL